MTGDMADKKGNEGKGYDRDAEFRNIVMLPPMNPAARNQQAVFEADADWIAGKRQNDLNVPEQPESAGEER